MFAFSFNFFIVGFHLTDIFHPPFSLHFPGIYLSLPSQFQCHWAICSSLPLPRVVHGFPFFFFPPVLVVFSLSLPSLALSVVLPSAPPHPLSPPPPLMILFSPSLILYNVTPLPPLPGFVHGAPNSLLPGFVPSVCLVFFCLLVNKVFNIISFL